MKEIHGLCEKVFLKKVLYMLNIFVVFMFLKRLLSSKIEWVRYGVIVSLTYSLILIFFYVTSFIPLPNTINSLFDKLYELLFLPQIYVSGNILLKTGIAHSYRSFNTLFYLLQLIFTIPLGFIIGAVISVIKSKMVSG